jgi:hypothetical protein
MTPKELERLEKDSIYAVIVNSDLKDQVINGHLSELNRIVKANAKRKKLFVAVMEINN